MKVIGLLFLAFSLLVALGMVILAIFYPLKPSIFSKKGVGSPSNSEYHGWMDYLSRNRHPRGK